MTSINSGPLLSNCRYRVSTLGGHSRDNLFIPIHSNQTEFAKPVAPDMPRLVDIAREYGIEYV